MHQVKFALKIYFLASDYMTGDEDENIRTKVQ